MLGQATGNGIIVHVRRPTLKTELLGIWILNTWGTGIHTVHRFISSSLKHYCPLMPPLCPHPMIDDETISEIHL
jgi:hypothetical protein